MGIASMEAAATRRSVSAPSHADITCASAPRIAARALRNRIQYRLQIRWRAADDAQDFAGRRLLLQRFGERLVPFLSSLNSRTFSIAITAWSAKVLSSVDLLVGEWTALPCGGWR